MAVSEGERSFFLELEATAKRLSVATTKTDAEGLRGLFDDIRTDMNGGVDPNGSANDDVSAVKRGSPR